MPCDSVAVVDQRPWWRCRVIRQNKRQVRERTTFCDIRKSARRQRRIWMEKIRGRRGEIWSARDQKSYWRRSNSFCRIQTVINLLQQRRKVTWGCDANHWHGMVTIHLQRHKNYLQSCIRIWRVSRTWNSTRDGNTTIQIVPPQIPLHVQY